MTILEELRKLIVSKGGSISGIVTISDAVKKLTAMENADNPLSALAIDVDSIGSTDLLGKVASDLQKDVVIGFDKITGTSKYVTGYTGFSGVTEEQSGNYIVLHADVEGVTGETIKCGTSDDEDEVTLDSDGLIIIRLQNHMRGGTMSGLSVHFTASKSGYPDYRVDYKLDNIVLQPAS